MATTATKANASGAAGVVTVILSYYMTLIPWWSMMSPEVQGAHIVAVAYGLNWLATYYAPENKGVIPARLERPLSVTQPEGA